jgi:hypothetical protein
VCSGVIVQSVCGVGLDGCCPSHTLLASVSVLTRGSYGATFLLCQTVCGIWRGVAMTCNFIPNPIPVTHTSCPS